MLNHHSIIHLLISLTSTLLSVDSYTLPSVLVGGNCQNNVSTHLIEIYNIETVIFAKFAGKKTYCAFKG